MKRRTLLKNAAVLIAALNLDQKTYAALLSNDNLEKIAEGPFQPTWDSLSNYQTPDWFRDAKFGMWAHWGPQCQPEFGDWYGRKMYFQDNPTYEYHLKKYGHPSKFGFKDVINDWRAEQWDPGYLVSLYQKAGAKYFMCMANHHDNFDLYDSRYQKWNSLHMGPKKDVVSGWAEAAKKNGLPFGVSVHASHAWNWYEPAQGSDSTGTLAGVPYDGNTTKNDGAGHWWKRYNPQELYWQRHPVSKRSSKGVYLSFDEWKWGGDITRPSQQFINNVYNRTIDLINKYDPDMLYFDDTVLPFWPIDDAGLKIAAHMYNHSIRRHGKLNAVITGKFLDEKQRQCMTWDFERGASNEIEPLPWQTDTCLGDWHYSREVYYKNEYKSAKNVIQTLIDVVSKNGNLMLNVPVRGNGTIDEKESAVVEGITEWMGLNGTAIYATRPWKVAGEGPRFEADSSAKKQAGFSEAGSNALTASDIRFTQKGDSVYAFLLGRPAQFATIKNMAQGHFRSVSSVSMVATGEQLKFKQNERGLQVAFPERELNGIANVIHIQ